jgi:hypothetical protein
MQTPAQTPIGGEAALATAKPTLLDLASQPLTRGQREALKTLCKFTSMRASHGSWFNGNVAISSAVGVTLALRGLAKIERPHQRQRVGATIKSTLAGRLLVKQLDHATVAKAYSEVDDE